MKRDAFSFFKPIATGFMPAGNEETVLGLLSKEAPDPELDFTAQVVLTETSYSGRSVIEALQNFATVAGLIIQMFNSP